MSITSPGPIPRRFSMTISPAVRKAFSSRYLREPLLVVLCYIPYFLARENAVSNARTAFQNAAETIRFEQSIGILAEVSVQSATMSYSFLTHMFNIIYFYGHWPVILVFGTFLFIKNP